MKNKTQKYNSIVYLLVLVIWGLSGCTATEGEPVVVDRPTVIASATPEKWSIDFLVNNRWRVVEAVIGSNEKVMYDTLHLTRIGFGQWDSYHTIGVQISCSTWGGVDIVIGQSILLDELTQTYTLLEDSMTNKLYCTGVSEASDLLFSLAIQEDVRLTKAGNQIIFESKKGRLVLEIDNEPVVYDTPVPAPPTAYP